jgi:serine/threonine protein kinase/Leucine-rich repeat (LRR) protein
MPIAFPGKSPFFWLDLFCGTDENWSLNLATQMSFPFSGSFHSWKQAIGRLLMRLCEESSSAPTTEGGPVNATAKMEADEASSSSGTPRQDTGWIEIQPIHLRLDPKTNPGAANGSVLSPCGVATESSAKIQIPPAIEHLHEGKLQADATDCLSGISLKPRNYAIGSLMAEGGMGAIHKVTDLNIKRTVAMKTLRSDAPLSRQDVLRFIQEAQVNGGLEHPNIVPVYELGQDETGKPFYTMKLIHGVTLEDVLAGIQRGDAKILAQYPLAALLMIFEKICDAVAFAHSKGILHRDLKPSNIMVGEFGEVLVVDWGMAKVLDGTFPDDLPARSTATLPNATVNVKDGHLTFGCLIGTPSFMAPEQAENRPVDTRTDIYALGGILYNILTLHSPHEEGEIFEMLERIKTGCIRPPSSHNRPRSTKGLKSAPLRKESSQVFQELRHCPEGRIPEALSLIAMKALALRTEDRYADVRDIQKDIQAYLGGFITSVETKGLFKSLRLLVQRHRTESIFLASSLLIMLTMGAIFIWDHLAGQQAQMLALKGQLKAEEDRRLLEEKNAAERRREWRPVFSEDFSQPDVTSRWEIEGAWKVERGELQVEGSSSCIRLRTPIPGDVRFTFDCRQESEFLSDISCFFSALKSTPLASAFTSGYLFQLGAMANQRIMIRRPSGILWNQRGSPLVRGKRYYVDIQRMGNRLICRINDRTILDVQDDRSVEGTEHAYVGFYFYFAKTHYSNIRVYTRDPALVVDLLEVAEDRLAHGKHLVAQDLFQQAVDSSHDAQRTERARKGLIRATQCQQMLASFQNIKSRLLKSWPGARVSIATGGIEIDIHGLGIHDLGPLKGLALSSLNCGWNRITSLEPLRGTELQSLACPGNQISDLEPLANMPVISLDCSENRIERLDPLHGMKLSSLQCRGNRISSLEPLRGMRLNGLDLSNNQVTSLDPLRGMELETLIFSGNQVSDLTPISGMPLSLVIGASNQIEDLRPLQGMIPVSVFLSDNHIQSLDPLKGMKLRVLYCDSNQVRSLEPLRGMPLSKLDCSGNPIETLAPLEGMKLEFLDCSDSPLYSLDPIVQHPPDDWLFDWTALISNDRTLFQSKSSEPSFAAAVRDATIRSCIKGGRRAELKSLAHPFEGHRYLVVRVKSTWVEARRTCKDLGGHLAVITSQRENDWLRSQVSPNARIAIGLVLDGETRRWITGKPLVFSNFNEPSGNTGFGFLSADGKWGLVPATDRISGFCIEWE